MTQSPRFHDSRGRAGSPEAEVPPEIAATDLETACLLLAVAGVPHWHLPQVSGGTWLAGTGRAPAWTMEFGPMGNFWRLYEHARAAGRLSAVTARLTRIENSDILSS